MKVLLVTPCVNLPVPAVKGGAVSTLMESLIRENEAKRRMELTVLSVGDEAAEREAKRYPATRFVFIRRSRIADAMDVAIDAIIATGKRANTKPHQYFRKERALRTIRKILKTQPFDRVILQNSGYLLRILKDREIRFQYKDKVYFHLHNDLPGNVYVSGLGQCRLLLISEYLKAKVNQACGMNMDARSSVIKNGFDCEPFGRDLSPQDRLDLRGQMGIAAGQKVVIFTGRIIPGKGIAELTEAVAKLSRPDITLLVVGAHNFGTGQTSAFQRRMEKRFAALGEQVKFTGYVPYSEMWKYYQSADIAVLPSLWQEPAGLTMLEACAAKIPLITTNAGGIPEYISSEWAMILERDGRIEDTIAAAILTVLGNYDEWQEKAAVAQRYVREHFNAECFYNNFVDAITGEESA